MRFKRLASVSAIIMAAALIRWLRPRLTAITFDSTPSDHLPDDGSEFVEIDGLRVRTLVRGSGEPVIVLLHGFAASVFTWGRVIDELAKLGTVIAFDRPGFGFTSRPEQRGWTERNPYSLEGNVDLTIAMLDHFGIEQAVLVGHSAGGTVASLTAVEHPERLRSLVLVAPAIYIGIPPPEWIHWLIDSAPMRRSGPHIARVTARFTEQIMRRVWHDPSLITQEVVEGYLAPFRVSGWAAGMWEVVCANLRTRLGPHVDGLTVPTLMITGDDDRIVPTRQTVRAAHAIPRAELVIFADCGHIPQEEKPEEFLESVNRFLDSQFNVTG